MGFRKISFNEGWHNALEAEVGCFSKPWSHEKDGLSKYFAEHLFISKISVSTFLFPDACSLTVKAEITEKHSDN